MILERAAALAGGIFQLGEHGCRVEGLERQQIVLRMAGGDFPRGERSWRKVPQIKGQNEFGLARHGAREHVAILRVNPPSLNQAVRMVASLGGFLGRKGDGEPGTQTLWLGLQRLDDPVLGWCLRRADPALVQHARAPAPSRGLQQSSIRVRCEWKGGREGSSSPTVSSNPAYG